ncbi:MAG: YciI family protein [Nocardioidaceae bacterium]
MRFLVLMADDGIWDRLDDDGRKAVMQAHLTFAEVAGQRATIVAGEALAASSEALTMRAAGDSASRALTDGPFAETAEQLGGFYLLEADSRDVVVDLCRLLPASYTIEIWPTVDIDMDAYDDSDTG